MFISRRRVPLRLLRRPRLRPPSARAGRPAWPIRPRRAPRRLRPQPRSTRTPGRKRSGSVRASLGCTPPRDAPAGRAATARCFRRSTAQVPRGPRPAASTSPRRRIRAPRRRISPPAAPRNQWAHGSPPGIGRIRRRHGP